MGWAEPTATKAGFAGVVLGREPTGHRGKPLANRADARGVDLVWVNPMVVPRGRHEDSTLDRSGFKDATISAAGATTASPLLCPP